MLTIFEKWIYYVVNISIHLILTMILQCRYYYGFYVTVDETEAQKRINNLHRPHVKRMTQEPIFIAAMIQFHQLFETVDII